MSTSRILGEVFYIKDGNVGLGTTIPRTILDIQNTNKIFLNVPNIGIGTTNPQAILHTVGTAIFDNKTTAGAVYIKGGVAGSTGPKLYLVGAGSAYSTTAIEFQNFDTGTNPSVAQILVFDEGNYNGSFRFSSKQPGALANPLVEHMRIQSDGNVGLGTTRAQQRLHVFGTATVSENIGIGTTLPRATLEINSTSAVLLPRGNSATRPTIPQGAIRYNTETSQFEGFGAGNVWGSLGGVKSTDQLTFVSAEEYAGANDSNIRFYTSGVERARINPVGNLGIGTIAPTHKLHIFSSSSDSNAYEQSGIFLQNKSIGELGIAFQNGLLSADGEKAWVIGINSNQSRLDIVYGLQSNLMNQQGTYMSFMTNGNIGIGTTLSLTNFQVEGLSTFGSIYVRDGLQLSPIATTVRNALQVKPARLSQRLQSNQSNITLSMPGYYIAHSSNVQIAINGFMLYNFTSSIANYNLTTSHLNQGTTTQFSIDFTNNLLAGDLVDITVWPNVIEVDASQGNVFQIVNNLDSVWNLSKSNLIGYEQFYTRDAYFNQGNLGIGTTLPLYPVDIYASPTHLNNVYFTSNAIGIGTATPQYELDVKGNIVLTGNIYKNNDLYVSSQWLTPPFTSNIYVLNSNVGIGTNTPYAKLHVNGNVILGDTIATSINTTSLITSNLNVIGNQFFYNNDTTTLRNRLQVQPIQIKFIASSNIISYSTTVDGLWKIEGSNTNVYINGTKMAYIRSDLNDYNVTYENLLTTTVITFSFEYGIINSQDIVDIEIWPSYINDTASNQPGFVLQNIQQTIQLTSNSYIYNGDYFLIQNPSTSNITFIDSVANIGIGTTVPMKPLHVEGGVQMSFGQVASIYFSGGNVSITNTGKRYYGFRISWENNSLTAQSTFRVSGKFHMTNNDGSQYGYLKLNSLISPFNNNIDSPKELILTNTNSNIYTTNTFNELSYDILRYSSNAVDLRIKWWIQTQPFNLYFEGRAFGTQSLGQFTFTEIQNTWV